MLCAYIMDGNIYLRVKYLAHKRIDSSRSCFPLFLFKMKLTELQWNFHVVLWFYFFSNKCMSVLIYYILFYLFCKGSRKDEEREIFFFSKFIGPGPVFLIWFYGKVDPGSSPSLYIWIKVEQITRYSGCDFTNFPHSAQIFYTLFPF